MRRKEITVNETELYSRLAKVTGYNIQVVRDVIKAQTEIVCDSLMSGTPVRIGLGEISIITYKCGGGFNFKGKHRNDQSLLYAKCKFKPSAVVKRVISEIKKYNKQQ